MLVIFNSCAWENLFDSKILQYLSRDFSFSHLEKSVKLVSEQKIRMMASCVSISISIYKLLLWFFFSCFFSGSEVGNVISECWKLKKSQFHSMITYFFTFVRLILLSFLCRKKNTANHSVNQRKFKLKLVLSSLHLVLSLFFRCSNFFTRFYTRKKIARYFQHIHYKDSVTMEKLTVKKWKSRNHRDMQEKSKKTRLEQVDGI